VRTPQTKRSFLRMHVSYIIQMHKILDDAGDSHQPLVSVRSGSHIEIDWPRSLGFKSQGSPRRLFLMRVDLDLDWIQLKDSLVQYSKYSILEEDERRVVVGGCQIILFMEMAFVVVVV
jgi:hypothetical protein